MTFTFDKAHNALRLYPFLCVVPPVSLKEQKPQQKEEQRRTRETRLSNSKKTLFVSYKHSNKKGLAF